MTFLFHILSWVYGLGACIHRKIYDWLPKTRLAVPVVVVGNLTCGGTGKTPMVVHLAKKLGASGKRVAILTRGYGGHCNGLPIKVGPQHRYEDVGDEAYWMAKKLPGVAVWVDPKRSRSGRRAAETADVILLDDGFQHHALHSDERIVLIDALNPFGNGKLLPLGPLREPISGLKRATRVVLMRCEGEPPAALMALIEHYSPGTPVSLCGLRASHLVAWPSGAELPLNTLNGKALGLFCGIANPQRFRELSEKTLAAPVVFCQAFADHHPFSKKELEGLGCPGIQAFLTTEKDAVRLPLDWQPGVPVYALAIELALKG